MFFSRKFACVSVGWVFENFCFIFFTPFLCSPHKTVTRPLNYSSASLTHGISERATGCLRTNGKFDCILPHCQSGVLTTRSARHSAIQTCSDEAFRTLVTSPGRLEQRQMPCGPVRGRFSMFFFLSENVFYRMHYFARCNETCITRINESGGHEKTEERGRDRK